MRLAIFSDCSSSKGHHPAFSFVLEALQSFVHQTTAHTVYIYASEALQAYCEEWASNMLFCKVISPRESTSSDSESSPRRRKSLGSPRLAAWPLYMLDNCTHAIVFIHSDSKEMQRIVVELIKRTGRIQMFHIYSVSETQQEKSK